MFVPIFKLDMPAEFLMPNPFLFLTQKYNKLNTTKVLGKVCQRVVVSQQRFAIFDMIKCVVIGMSVRTV